MKSYSTLDTREVKVKLTMRYHYICNKIAKIKIVTLSYAGEDTKE